MRISNEYAEHLAKKCDELTAEKKRLEAELNTAQSDVEFLKKCLCMALGGSRKIVIDDGFYRMRSPEFILEENFGGNTIVKVVAR